MFDGSFPMGEEVNNEPQEKSGMFFSLSEPMHKMAHKIPLHKCEKRELQIKSDLKPYFEDAHLKNLGANFFRQGEDDTPIEGHGEEHANNLPKSKKHQEGQGLSFPDLPSESSNFLTLVT